MERRVISLAWDGGVKHERRALAERVIDHFAPSLPDLRLTVILDGSDWWELKEIGTENRGMFRLVNTDHIFDEPKWPLYLMEIVAPFDVMTGKFIPSCDAAVYLHNSTCGSVESLTMTLAHELQHAVQYAHQRRVWAYNGVVLRFLEMCSSTFGLEWKDIPIEREARSFAKRVCVDSLGSQATARYIENRIAASVNDRDRRDWEFIKSIDVTSESIYDITAETGKLFRTMRSNRAGLEQALASLQSLLEYADLSLDEAFDLA